MVQQSEREQVEAPAPTPDMVNKPRRGKGSAKRTISRQVRNLQVLVLGMPMVEVAHPHRGIRRIVIIYLGSVPARLNCNMREQPLEQLGEMGVPRKQAAKTLRKTDGNLNAALERPGLGDGNVEVVGCKRPSAGQMLRRKGGRGSSSMYDAVGYTFLGQHGVGGELRLKVAKDVGANPLVYAEELATLGRSWEVYCKDVVNPESGFEQIELSILSKSLELVITSVDIETSIARTYGAEQHFKRRVFVIFDGTHYDALAEAASLTAPEKHDTKQFVPWDSQKEDMAKKVAADFKAANPMLTGP